MIEMLNFPARNAKIEKAIDVDGNTIGVSIIMLVFPEDFDKLPGMFREGAQRAYAASSHPLATAETSAVSDDR